MTRSHALSERDGTRIVVVFQRWADSDGPLGLEQSRGGCLNIKEVVREMEVQRATPEHVHA